METESIDVKFASLDKFILGKTLGSGSNSKVKLGWDPTSDEYYAIKIIKHSNPLLNTKALKREIEILTSLKHSGIIQILGCFGSVDYVKKNGQTYKVVALIMELVSGGELYEYIAEFGRFSEEAARTYFKMLIDSVEYCHQKGIVHRDLKPENLLFDDNFHLKIADFGFATLLEGQDGTGKLKTYLGTESYMAPELHLGKEYSGVAVDLFACGIILFILMTGRPPFSKAIIKQSWYQFIANGEVDKFWALHENSLKHPGQGSFFSDSFKNLMNAMFAFDPEQRPSIEDIKNHMWYLGETINLDLIKEEFLQRKTTIEAKLKKQREAKQQKKLLAKMQSNFAIGAYSGFKPYRSLETEICGPQESLTKFDFSKKRAIQKYQEKAGFKLNTEVMTVMDSDMLLRILCAIVDKSMMDVNLSPDVYKLKGKVVQDNGRCSLAIVLTKVDESTTCIEFHHKNGNKFVFYQTIEEIKKKLPELECEEEKEEDAKKEEKIEA